MNEKLKVLHVSPTYFSKDSVLGGGERYVHELARAMSEKADVTLLSFGKENQSFSDGHLNIIIKKSWMNYKKNILNPINLNIIKEIKNADIIHVHQVFTLMTEFSIVVAKFFGKPIFLTDHGGGGATFFISRGLSKKANKFLCVSQYSSEQLAHLHPRRFVIYGGVDENKFVPRKIAARVSKSIVSFGRILPHKGFHHLVQAIDNHELTIIGSPKDLNYLNAVKVLARDKKVKFIHNLDDEQLKIEIKKADLAVFASTNMGIKGEKLPGQPELLGIAPLEAMALNVPTLVSNVGAYPEICFNKTDYLFEQGNVEDLKLKINYLMDSDNEKLDSNFHEHVKTKFTWTSAAEKCLEQYGEKK